jgi:hypothetical protein
VEQVDEFCVGKEVPVEKAIKRMDIGEVKPQEEDDEDCKIVEESPSTPPAANPRESGEKPENSGFPEAPEKTPETSDLLLVILKAFKKMRF